MAEKDSNHRILFLSITILLFVAVSSHLSVPILAHSSINDGSGSSPFSSPHEYEDELDHHHLHDHDHGGCNHDHNLRKSDVRQRRMLPEELAEEEDLKLDSSLGHHYHEEHHHHNHEEKQLSGLGLWVSAMGCSLLVSMASLICLILLPVLFLKGKPSKMVVDAMATFGAGAMLGDSFLHQLPHAFSGGHSHSHNHDVHDHEMSHSHSHSLQDLSVGLSVLFGIVLFLLVEKVVRYVEEVSRKGGNSWGHGHHHHRSHSKLKDQGTNGSTSAVLATPEGNSGDESEVLKNKEQKESEVLRQRVSVSNPADAKKLDASIDSLSEKKVSLSDTSASSPSSLVFGYLNLFSDGVHNFTDGMALGSAFLLYGSVGGWSRTLFLLAHELPQEIGDFGILVHSGFTVSKALFFNFLSALVALIGTALALLLGKDPGQSSLIEGFTAGGFIYISVAGVLPEMNNGSTSFKNTLIQLSSLLLGMGVALCISLAE